MEYILEQQEQCSLLTYHPANSQSQEKSQGLSTTWWPPLKLLSQQGWAGADAGFPIALIGNTAGGVGPQTLL